MATERQSPDAALDTTNYSASAIGDIQDDPDSPDANWWTWDGNGNTRCRVSFPTPSGNPTTGAGLQEFRVQIRKTSSGGASTTWSLQLWENGSQLSVLATGTTTSTGGEVVNGTWDASSLGTADGSLVECRLQQTGGGTGGSRRGIEVGAVEWNVDYTDAPDPINGTSDGTSTVTGSIRGLGVITSISADGVASVSGDIAGRLATTGTSDGTSTVTGSVLGRGVITTISADGIATVTGSIFGRGLIAGANGGIATAIGTISDINASGSNPANFIPPIVMRMFFY